MSNLVRKSLSVLLTYLSSLILVLAVFSVPLSVGPISIGTDTTFAQECDESEYSEDNCLGGPSGGSGGGSGGSGIGPDYDGFNDECDEYYDNIHDCPNPDADGLADEPSYVDLCLRFGYFFYC